MQKESFDVFCPTCNILIEARVIARGFGEYRTDATSPLEGVDTEYHGDHYSIALCGRCKGPFLVREALYGIAAEFETVTDEAVLFPTSVAPSLEGLPTSVSRSLDQAHRSFSTASYDACALMCRRALEAVCKHLSGDGSNLAQRVAQLHKSGHIDDKLLRWAHGVRITGNDAAHEVDFDVTSRDARDILDLTEAIAMYVFSLDAKFRAFEARRDERSRRSTEGAT